MLLKALRRIFADRTPPPSSTTDGAAAAFNNAVLEIHSLITAGDVVQADERIARLLATRPSDPDLQFLLGLNALEKADQNGAAAHLENAIALQPDFGAAHVQLAQLHDALHEPDRAQQHYEAAIELMPEVGELHNALGLIHLSRKHLSEAESRFLRALELDPGSAAAQNNLGRVYSERKQYDAAIACFAKAIELDPDDVHARVNTALALNQLGDREQALKIFLACRAEVPDHLEVIEGLATVNFALGRLTEAEQYYREALALDGTYANAHFGLANIALVQGDLGSGWEQYEWRMRLPVYAHNYVSSNPPRHGEPIAGKTLLVSAEQGYGDILLFVRFLPSLKERGAHVIFRCHPPLFRLLATCFDTIRVIESESGEPVTADASVPLLSVARLLDIGLTDLPGPIPYLWPPAVLATAWRGKINATRELRVGLAWGGNVQRAYERGRVPSMEDFRALAEIPNVAFYNLQLGLDARDIARFPLPLTDLTANIEDFADTAALVENLDLVISVDTSVAHLCGAMGKPTWLLHPGVPDWRWEIGSNASPWYPTVRLFRRQNEGWAQAFAAIASALKVLAQKHDRSGPKSDALAVPSA